MASTSAAVPPCAEPSAVPTEKDFFTSEASGKRIFTKRWPIAAGAKPKALMFISHGVGEHCQRYNLLGRALAELGILAFSHDHYGHGHSGGHKVDVEDFSLYVKDIFQHCDAVTQEFPRTKVFLFGHSMGGAIAISAGITRSHYFDAVVLSAPAIVPDPATATPVKVAAAKFFAWLAPQLQVGAVPPTFISRDPAVVAAYAVDPLNWHGGLKARWASVLLKQLDVIQAAIPGIEWPFIVLQGTEDKLVNFAGAETLYNGAASKDKTYKKYEGYYHELLNEPKEYSDIVLKDIIDWLTPRI
ncbi:hypothetical protein CAOG_08754 [Capsaspora owczarzaki ATCC 30864]|uniref:Serine aminopeptidase S33 domain-containing protein n=1 Tax=Capsaspora owczarzaki (strain ATCC 30864) TaxID=595528 RepID=A0A0D2WPI2_CAPO3|nr:hypothetical protein CAOG_08754 [Capsaspora owczarzaki ATCC 30864]KJE93310.1 hypothetical protein CAOG_008754 [Capsaspora owczarzaki ATCC 30864]|eukprot:XP_011270384.1 hypothetical protein CAOG_08754 [Capsaspora owczarzaki ATCC 30864]